MIQMFKDLDVYPEDVRLKVRKLLRDYALEIYQNEWRLMDQGKESEAAQDLYYNLWQNYADYTPITDKQKIWYQESISKLNELSAYRTTRIFNTGPVLGPLMWTLLIAGAIITIIFMYFFYAEYAPAQYLMTALLSGSIGFMLFLIMSLEGVYSGDTSVHPDELKRAIERFDTSMDQGETKKANP